MEEWDSQEGEARDSGFDVKLINLAADNGDDSRRS